MSVDNYLCINVCILFIFVFVDNFIYKYLTCIVFNYLSVLIV